jgi:hypothetical protein
MYKKDWWLKMGCFLTGYEYTLLQECSAISRNTVKRFLSALVIITLIWMTIGYAFCTRYLGFSPFWSCIGSALMGVFIIQIERQIILSFSGNIGLRLFRVVIAILMAAIGSVILDQVLFQKDIDSLIESNKKFNQNLISSVAESNKRDSISKERLLSSNRILEKIDSATEIALLKENALVTQSESTIIAKDSSRTINIGRTKNPKLEGYEKELTRHAGIIALSDSSIKTYDDSLRLRKERLNKSLKPVNSGFLNELNLFFSFILTESSSKLPLAVWVFFICFFLSAELFVLMVKERTKNDYELLAIYQRDKHAIDIETMYGRIREKSKQTGRSQEDYLDSKLE